MASSYYHAPVQEFLHESKESVLGKLAEHHDMELVLLQKNVWMQQIEVLKQALISIEGMVFFEFTIPRMGKRADNVLLLGSTIVILEFKFGDQGASSDARMQVMDYALDLKNFHAGSRRLTIIPVLVIEGFCVTADTIVPYEDDVCPVITTNLLNLAALLQKISLMPRRENVLGEEWATSGYRPTPTIIQASQALYAGHGVESITRSEAGADNLGATTRELARIIDQAKSSHQKAICFVTGVPGSGKTLAGLNLASARRLATATDEEHAVFLSGNGPLVQVLQEALARDENARIKNQTGKGNKSAAVRKTKSFIQNIHHFRDECLQTTNPPLERVVVFDEAQRAWDLDQTQKFMRQKKGLPNFEESEPAFLIGAMNRHPKWSVIVCLVGGGQEINTGEAGLGEWINALAKKYPEWRVYASSEIPASEYVSKDAFAPLAGRVEFIRDLHLHVSLRSFRSERLAIGIGELLSGSPESARKELVGILARYPIAITRSLTSAKGWLRQHARGSERFGLLASSRANRLKSIGIQVKAGIDPCNYFLNDATDVRSAFYLEDVATEFEVQGLELDWAAVIWDGNLLRTGDGWSYQDFRGNRWETIQDETRKRYLLNAYRVLLTRARQGLVIVVPEGDPTDPTRPARFYDPTWEYLRALGVEQLADA